MAHIALLGDSILDNGAYTGGRPDVVTHLRRLLPPGATATLLAFDGSTTEDVLERQIARLPPDVTNAVVSMGGNDALHNADALDLAVSSTREALAIFGQRAAAFEAIYRRALAAIVQRVQQTTVCTIYNGNLPGDEGALARWGLVFFNDVILRVAAELHVPVIELRLVMRDPADFANALEPSSRGAEKIARAIATALDLGGSSSDFARVFAPIRLERNAAIRARRGPPARCYDPARRAPLDGWLEPAAPPSRRRSRGRSAGRTRAAPRLRRFAWTSAPTTRRPRASLPGTAGIASTSCTTTSICRSTSGPARSRSCPG